MHTHFLSSDTDKYKGVFIVALVKAGFRRFYTSWLFAYVLRLHGKTRPSIPQLFLPKFVNIGMLVPK